MTHTKDEALKLAKAWFERNTYGDEAVEVYEAIEQALAAPVQPVQEPHWYFIDKTGVATLCTDEDDAKQGAKQAEKAWPRFAPYRAVQLCEYTPPAQPAPVPLTPDQRKNLWVSATIELPSQENCYYRGLVDAEAYHGITAAPEKGGAA